ncbi:MAG TPA: hypothetical protein VMU35_02250 [Methylomirabilota bacterium]|nr:hypothetical protein [Methylomirabilota bacterium]
MTSSKRVALTAVLIAVGAVARISIGNITMFLPTLLYGYLIAVGLTETLTFITGFTLGPVAGFVSGLSIIVISDIATIPGPWTLPIGIIIGIIGVFAAVIRRLIKQLDFRVMVVSAILLTILSETLQNLTMVALFNTPIIGTLWLGMPTLVAALANNLILFPTVGLRVIRMILGSASNGNNSNAILP